MRRFILAVAACSLTGVTGGAGDKPKTDAELVQGSWDWDPAAKQSDAKPQILLERVVVKGDTLTLHYSFDGKPFTSASTFKLDPTASPKRIDFTPTEGSNKGQAYPGLYDVTAGQLQICYRGPGDSRPKDFTDKFDRNTNGCTTFIVLKPSRANG